MPLQKSNTTICHETYFSICFGISLLRHYQATNEFNILSERKRNLIENCIHLFSPETLKNNICISQNKPELEFVWIVGGLSNFDAVSAHLDLK